MNPIYKIYNSSDRIENQTKTNQIKLAHFRSITFFVTSVCNICMNLSDWRRFYMCASLLQNRKKRKCLHFYHPSSVYSYAVLALCTNFSKFLPKKESDREQERESMYERVFGCMRMPSLLSTASASRKTETCTHVCIRHC